MQCFLCSFDNYPSTDLFTGPQLCMNSPVDPALLHLVHQEVKSLEDNLDKLSVEFEEERAKVRQLLRTVSTDLEQMRQSVLRLKTGQQNLECRTGIVEERMDDVEGRINDFEGRLVYKE